jgi:hypothetical protein
VFAKKTEAFCIDSKFHMFSRGLERDGIRREQIRRVKISKLSQSPKQSSTAPLYKSFRYKQRIRNLIILELKLVILTRRYLFRNLMLKLLIRSLSEW